MKNDGGLADLIGTDTESYGIDNETKACVRLWAAVFRLGAEDYARSFLRIGPKTVDLGYIRASRDWVDLRDSSLVCVPGSFNWLCDLFSYDPENARMQLMLKRRSLINTYKTRARREKNESTQSDKAAACGDEDVSGIRMDDESSSHRAGSVCAVSA